MYVFGNPTETEMSRSSENIPELVAISNFIPSVKTEMAQYIKKELVAHSSLDGILVLNVLPTFDIGSK